MMIERRRKEELLAALSRFPAVALLGPRQVGKTTLAHAVMRAVDRDTIYLDLERDSDRAKLEEAELYLARHDEKLVVIDEVQRRPNLFPLLRSLIDERIRRGDPTSHFLLLGSATRDLLQQSSESLAGRIAYRTLAPLTSDEILGNSHDQGLVERHWLRGGFPLSYLAADEQSSWEWRSSFISTYLERDIPNLGVGLSAELARRFWSMLAFNQGGSLNAARLAEGLGVSGTTVRRYLDLLTDLFMVRQLNPWSGNSLKRLVKAPKVYVRDSGILHRLAGISSAEMLFGHQLVGPSWEGYVIEQLLERMPDTWRASYYRTSAGAEIDLVIEGPTEQVVAMEVKRTLRPRQGKGFRHGCEDIGATHRLFVVPSSEGFPISRGVEALPIWEVIDFLSSLWRVDW